MPIMFKFGTEKGRFVFIISIALISASGALLQGADNTVILKVLSISPLLLLTVAILLNVISILISVRIKSKS
ncbi:MAG: ABC-2 transporter permease, partial [Oscillospiraceae bacterium]